MTERRGTEKNGAKPVEIVFTFTDTRNAVCGEGALEAAGVGVRVMPRPSVLGEGCGICLRVNEGERLRAEDVFRENSIIVEAIYRRIREKGGIQYLPDS